MRLPESVRRRFQRYGRAGGVARHRALSAAKRKAIARRAAVRRWTRVRFGRETFASLSLPGADLVDAGLMDLAAREETLPSLLVSMAAPRLRREGVPVPAVRIAEPESKLYELLTRTEGDLAHARYNAYRRQIVSFADACRTVRRHAR